MTKTKSTKRALLLSALSLLMCVSMLIGSTFAWFTDSVTSVGNTIQSGTLDVDLVDADGNSMEGKVIEFKTADGRAQSEILWEPGCTYETKPVFVVNKGNLALQYQIVINGLNGDAKLLEAIEWTVNGQPIADMTGILLPEAESDAIVLSGHMKEEAGNEYQDLTVKGISISVFATQLAHENDSFNNQYDDIAIVSDADALKAAIVGGKNVMLTADVALDGNATITVADGASVVLDLNGHDISAVSTAIGKNRAAFTVKGEMSVIGNGTVSFVHKGDNMGRNNLTAAFSIEGGELTLGKGVTVENGGGSDMAYGVDVNSTLGETVLNVDGATILSTYTGVRIFNNSKTAKAIVNYNSGVIVGEKRDIWNQSPSEAAVVENAIVNIADGYKYTTESSEYGGCKYFFEDDMTLVGTADALTKAIENGGKIVLLADRADVDANTAITIASGKEVVLDLNGHKISSTANKTGNQELFLVKGTMTVTNGSLELVAENNQGWNSMATLFDVTAGGVLNMEGVTAEVSGTDMNFIVHLNNWGSATLNVDNCDFNASYVAVRAFNSGNDMNTVTIENTDVTGGARLFWVHNYTAEGKDDSTLTLDIYSNNNTCDNEKPVRFGFDNSVYYDLDGSRI